MKALILVGGYGTRLRPLTISLPKPIVSFCNKPILLHQIEALVAVGVNEVILAVNHQPEALTKFLESYEKEHPNVKIRYSLESEPMGTAGPLALARQHLEADGEPFFVLNSDVTCSYPFADLLAYHKKHGKEGTILVTEVTDPSKYGVVISDASGKIEKFVEKPQVYVGNHINAGMYILNPAILNRIPLKPTSIERDVFPKMAADNQLYAMPLPGFWMDIGQPRDFINGTKLYLNHLKIKKPAALSTGDNIKGNVLISSKAKVGANCKIGPDVVIGDDCVIGDGVSLSNCSVMNGVTIKNFAYVDTAIIGMKSTIGSWARVESQQDKEFVPSVIADDVQVGDTVCLCGVFVLPHKGVNQSYRSHTILM